MNIRRYEKKDLSAVLQLFYDSVHAVCTRDCTKKEQLFAWADGNPNRAEWNVSLLKNETYVAEENGTVIGFANLENKNYLNRLYVHKDFQRQGGAAALCGFGAKCCRRYCCSCLDYGKTVFYKPRIYRKEKTAGFAPRCLA